MEEDVPEDEDDEWVKDDRKAKATIILSIDDNQLPIVKTVFTRMMCLMLCNRTIRSQRDRYGFRYSKSCVRRICRNAVTSKSICENSMNFLIGWTPRVPLDKDTKICMILRSLPPSLDVIVTALDNRADDDISSS